MYECHEQVCSVKLSLNSLQYAPNLQMKPKDFNTSEYQLTSYCLEMVQFRSFPLAFQKFYLLSTSEKYVEGETGM